MYTHILLPVAIDEDPDLDRTRKVASTLLNKGGKLTLFHAVEPIPTYVSTYFPPDFEIQSRSKAKERLEKIAAEVGVDDGPERGGGRVPSGN